MTAVRGGEELPPEKKAELRAALASVYFETLGKQTQLRSGPGMFLPNAIRPLPLEAALKVLKPYEQRFREAVWTVLRSVPPPRSEVDVESFDSRYPSALYAVEPPAKVEEYDGLRRRYRSEANLFAAALVALANSEPAQVTGVYPLDADGPASEFSQATCDSGVLGGLTPEEFWEHLVSEDPEQAALDLVRLEQEVDLSIYAFVQEFADAVAYLHCWDLSYCDGVFVFPAATSINQDPVTLTTSVTVTALVRAPSFDLIRMAIDPRSWANSSDVFATAMYVESATDLTKVELETEIGEGFPDDTPRPFLEQVNVSWGPGANQVGAFRNVLSIDKFETDAASAALEFSLDRCLSSRFLWDQRAGGIVIDEGYVKARPLTDGLWRVTTRKLLQFSDRTPYSGGTGWFDFGQLLNYLAPATLTWWLESEVYSSAESAVTGDAPADHGGE